jgi:hypothetical protein
MLRQQMQSASLSICQSALSLSQLRLVPKVGQMGSTMFEGGSITKVLQVKLLETTPNQSLQILTKELQVLQCLHNTQIDTKIQEDVSEINT